MRRVCCMAASALALCAVVALAMSPAFAAQAKPPGAVKSFTIVAVSIDAVPFWLPSSIHVYQGDRVRLVLENWMGGEPNVHGFAIPAYHITELIPHGATKSVEFTANKVGVFPYICQIHARHIGGQLIVLPRPSAGAKGAR